MTMPTPQPRSAAPAAKKPVSRAQLTDAQKREQQLLAKIKRLNLKLAKVKSVAVSMSTISNRHNEVSATQTNAWAKTILDTING